MRGKKVGSWFGGDEAEFLAMLHTVGMSGNDVKLIPEQDNPNPQLMDGQLDVIESVRYAPGDMTMLYDKFPKDKLTFLYPENYHVAMVNTGMFTTERTIKKHPELGAGRGRRHLARPGRKPSPILWPRRRSF